MHSGAYYAYADAVLLAVQKSVYGIGTLIGRYRDGKYDRRKLARLIKMSQDVARDIVQIETLVLQKVKILKKLDVNIDLN